MIARIASVVALFVCSIVFNQATAQVADSGVSAHGFVIGQTVPSSRLNAEAGRNVWLVPTSTTRRNDGGEFELRALDENGEEVVLMRRTFTRHARFVASLNRIHQMATFRHSQNYSQSQVWLDFQNVEGGGNWPTVGKFYSCRNTCSSDLWGEHQNPMLRGWVVVLNDGTFVRGDFEHDLENRGADLVRIEDSMRRRNPDCRVGEFYFTVSARCADQSSLEISVRNQRRSESAFGDSSILIDGGHMLIVLRAGRSEIQFERHQLHRAILDNIIESIDSHVPEFTRHMVEEARTQQDQYAVDPF